MVSAILTPVRSSLVSGDTLKTQAPTSLTWVRAEAFPVTATFWTATNRASNRSKLHSDSLCLVLASHSIASSVQELPVESCSYSLARGKDAVEIRITDTNGAVLHTQGAEPESRNRANLANALLSLPSIGSQHMGSSQLNCKNGKRRWVLQFSIFTLSFFKKKQNIPTNKRTRIENRARLVNLPYSRSQVDLFH